MSHGQQKCSNLLSLYYLVRRNYVSRKKKEISLSILSLRGHAVNMSPSEWRHLSLFSWTPRISSAASMTPGHDFSHLLLTPTILKRQTSGQCYIYIVHSHYELKMPPQKWTETAKGTWPMLTFKDDLIYS